MASRACMQIAASLVMLISVSEAYGHDIWLAPEQFVVSRGDTLTVHLLVGHGLEKELEVPLQKEVASRFELITADHTVDLLGGQPDRSFPVLRRNLDFDGPALLIMEHGFTYIELSDEKFVRYLEHEEFHEATAHRKQVGPAKARSPLDWGGAPE